MDITEYLVISDIHRVALHNNILHAAHIVHLVDIQAEPPWPGVSTQKQWIIRISGAHSGNSNPWLGEDLVDRQCDDILCFDSMDLMPLAVAKLECIIWFEDGCDRSSAIVHGELDRAVHHLENEVISPSFHSNKNSTCISWFDHHCDVKVKTNSETLLCSYATTTGSEEKNHFQPFQSRE